MITIESLTRTYGDFTAVDDIGFTAQPGRLTGFLGPNGARKSTTMRMIVGLTRPSAGSATVTGRSCVDLTVNRRRAEAHEHLIVPDRRNVHLPDFEEISGMPRCDVAGTPRHAFAFTSPQFVR